MKNLNNPKLRFVGFSDAWVRTKVGTLGAFLGGGTPSSKNEEYWKGDIPWISSSDLIDESIYHIRVTRLITKKAITESATKLIPEKSILIVSRVGVGKVAVNEQELCTSQDFISIVPWKHDYIFLAYLIKLKSTRLLEFNQGTSIKGFVKSDLQELEVSIPSQPEQQKLAAFLTAVDDKIQQLSKKKALLEQYKKGVMQQIFNQKIRFKDDAGNYYPNWQQKKLGDLTEKVSRKNKDLIEAELYSVTNSNGFVLQSEHFDRLITSTDLSTYRIIKKHEFAYNPARINVGSIAHFKNDVGLISSLYVCFFTIDSLNDDFLEYLLDIKTIKDQILSLGEGGVRIYLWYDLFSQIKIQLPCLQEQTKIASFLSAIDKKINRVNQQLEQTKQYKKGLLQRMFV